MAKLTWTGGDSEDATLEWNAITFHKGKAVEVTDANMISKAKRNHSFEVEENGQAPKEEKKEYDFRETEKVSGYTPVKKKVRKKRAVPVDPGISEG